MRISKALSGSKDIFESVIDSSNFSFKRVCSILSNVFVSIGKVFGFIPCSNYVNPTIHYPVFNKSTQ
eukprot:09037.XXX_377512_377712_1 [CDS] Oithona nana genome sequencing.